jgi:hypothetical protein
MRHGYTHSNARAATDVNTIAALCATGAGRVPGVVVEP